MRGGVVGGQGPEQMDGAVTWKMDAGEGRGEQGSEQEDRGLPSSAEPSWTGRRDLQWQLQGCGVLGRDGQVDGVVHGCVWAGTSRGEVPCAQGFKGELAVGDSRGSDHGSGCGGLGGSSGERHGCEAVAGG